MGLLGSAYYSMHPLVPSERVVANINLDMVGRYRYHRVLAPFSLNLRSHAIAALTLEVRVCLAVKTTVAPV